MNVPKKDKIKEVFDKISHDFSETRRYPWPEVVEYLKNEKEKNLSMDLGCGNGRHMKELKKSSKKVIGLDFSSKMINRARKNISLSKFNSNDFYFVQGDISYLPFKKNIFVRVLLIATLHHVPNKKERKNCLNEMYRVMKKGSDALISVWAIEHNEFNGKREKIRKNNFDYYVEWQSKGIKEKRFYHIYNRDNFSELLQNTKFQIEEIKLSSGNYYATVKKTT